MIDVTHEATSFEAPGRVCIYAEVSSDLLVLLKDRNDAEIRSIKQEPSALTSQIEQAVSSSLSQSHISLHDSQGSRIIRSYPSEIKAKLDCSNLLNATYAKVIILKNSSGRPYRIIASVKQNDKIIESTFERDAVSQIDFFYKNRGPYRENAKAIPLRIGIGWSVDVDIRNTMLNLFKKITWENL